MSISGSDPPVAVVTALVRRRAWGAHAVPLCCLSFIALAVGCVSAPGSHRISGEAYFSWLASSYSPVIEVRQNRAEGASVCVLLDGGKQMISGYVTIEDVVAAGEADPGLRSRADAYQRGFAQGMLEGMNRSGQSAKEHKKRLREGGHAPPDLSQDLLSVWQRGWMIGSLYSSRRAFEGSGSLQATEDLEAAER